MLADLTARYAEMPVLEAFARLYVDDAQFGYVFASLHERLNQHFDSINGRAKSTKHYLADASRDMLALIDELDDVLGSLKVNVQVLGLAAAVRDGRSRFGGGRGVAVVAERGFGDDPGL